MVCLDYMSRSVLALHTAYSTRVSPTVCYFSLGPTDSVVDRYPDAFSSFARPPHPPTPSLPSQGGHRTVPPETQQQIDQQRVKAHAMAW
jgi:hypothetical protein